MHIIKIMRLERNQTPSNYSGFVWLFVFKRETQIAIKATKGLTPLLRYYLCVEGKGYISSTFQTKGQNPYSSLLSFLVRLLVYRVEFCTYFDW